MSKRRISPHLTATIDFQSELNLLYRRRLALVNLIRSLEEYNLTNGMGSSVEVSAEKKKNLRLIYSQAVEIPA
jgi:hypothetical protein